MKQKKPPLPWATGPSKKPVVATPKEGASASLPSSLIDDDRLAAFSRLAHPLAAAKPNPAALLSHTFEDPVYDRKYRSKFFFRISPSIVEHVELLRRQEELARPNYVEPVNKQVVERSSAFKKELAPELDKRIQKVREYFLAEIAPLVMGAQAGADQAKEVIKTALDTDVEASTLTHFENMLRYGAQIKMARFITKYLGLSVKDAEVLLTKISTQQKNPTAFLMKELEKTLNAAPQTPSGQPNKPTRMERMRERGRAQDE